MPRHPVLFHFVAVPQTPAIEAAARRRMRWMEGTHSTVLAWELEVEGPRPAELSPAYAASASAKVLGGSVLCGTGRAADPLAAVRIALNALEVALEADQAQARRRAAAWLGSVRRRLGEGLALG